MLPIAAAIGVVGLRRLINVGEPVAGSVDWLSVVIAAIGFGSLVYGLSEVGVPGDHAPAYAALVVGVLGVALLRLAPAGPPAQRPPAARPAHAAHPGLHDLAAA